MPDKKDLIAAQTSTEEIKRILGVDHLNYLSIESLKKLGGENYCYACFDGQHPLL